MRELGRIKQFYSDINQPGKINYCYIESESQNNVLAYRQEIHFPESELKQGILVTFEMSSNGRECMANKVQLFDFASETDSYIIERCVKHFLPDIEQINSIILRLKNSCIEDVKLISHLAILLSIISINDYSKYIAILPDSVKQYEQILDILPAKEQVLILISKLKEERYVENKDILKKIENGIARVSHQDRILLIYLLPEWIRYTEPILKSFHLLTPEEQINLVWNDLVNGLLLTWHYLSITAKILLVYRLAKENQNISTFIEKLKKNHTNNPENDFLVKSVLKILWAKENPTRCNEVFQQVHELLIRYVIEYVNSSNEAINLDPLLPYCKPTEVAVKYCEGILWQRQGNQTAGETEMVTNAYCLRARSCCIFFEKNQNENSIAGLHGARLYADCSQDWKDWSLLELFQTAGIIPSLPELKKPEDYIPKLSGWINRINEIRSRLKCSVCGDIMPHNIEYAKFIAKFRVTIFSCKHGGNHDHNIYLNECWGCDAIIDSRESKYKSTENNYYICIHCGSGTQHSNTYTQGDICPKCGTIGMELNPYNNRYRKCRSCNHSIKVPDHKKITGSNCPECGTRGMVLTVNHENEKVLMCRSQSCTYSIYLSNQHPLLDLPS